jgi:Na+-transporting NADH:ubiquinone oxidoreductase subunit E
MEQLLSTILRAIFVDNMIFAYYLGMCSYLAVSKNVKTALGLGVAVTFVLVCTLPINYMLENYVLKEGALSWLGADFGSINLSFLSLIIFIAVIASFVQLVEMVVEKYAPSLYASLGIFLPLIAVNCAILGGSLFMQQKAFPNVGIATAYGFGSSQRIGRRNDGNSQEKSRKSVGNCRRQSTKNRDTKTRKNGYHPKQTPR